MQPALPPAHLRELIHAARGRGRCDLVIRGGFVVNVLTGEILRADVGVVRGHVAVVGPNGGSIEAEQVIDADNLFLAPGLMDSHMHLESSHLTPAEFARSVVPLGTTAVVIDPHEIANVAGVEGIEELAEASADLPLRFYLMISPAVPASDLETSGGRIDADDIAGFADDPRVLGIAEAMDFPSVLEASEEVLEKLEAMPGRVIDGHAPGLSGRDLQAYAAAGISSDHESTNSWEGLEKLRAGLYLMIREGSAARDLDELIKLVDIHTVARCLLVTDDLSPTDLLDRGHINHLLRKAVSHGVSAPQAIRMATLNAAQRFKIDRYGAIAPGYAADIAAFEDLAHFRAAFVVAKGELVAMDGEMTAPLHSHRFGKKLTHTVHLPELDLETFVVRASGGLARVIEIVEGEIITRQSAVEPTVEMGQVVSDSERDILKIAVVERHGKSGNVGVGLVNGFRLKSGALASSVAHDAHNVVVVGVDDRDMLRAVRRIGEMNGGLAVVSGGEVVADLPLPIAGLMSKGSAASVAAGLRLLEQGARDLGCRLEHPFMTLSFMCLSVIPELKITGMGLVDANESRVVPLFVGEDRAKRAAAG